MKLKIRHKLAIVLLITSIISMSIFATLGYLVAKRTSQKQTFEKLVTIRNSKAQEIERFFNKLQLQGSLIANSQITVDAFEKFNAAFNEIKHYDGFDTLTLKEIKTFRDELIYQRFVTSNSDFSITKDTFLSYLPQNNESMMIQAGINNLNNIDLHFFDKYEQALKQYDALIKKYMNYNDFMGALLINSNTGDIVYSVLKLSDLGGNLISDSLSATNLSEAFQELRYADKPVLKLIRFEHYFPSNFTPNAYMLSPIFKDGKNIAVIALRIPINFLNDPLTFDEKWEQNGLGKTGEVYIVGGSNKLRSELRPFLEDSVKFITQLKDLDYPDEIIQQIVKTNSTLLNIKINSESVNAALAGDTGIIISQNYLSKKVLSAYIPIYVAGVNYALIAEIEAKEAFENVAILKRYMIYSFMLVLITMVMVAFVLSYLITRPLNELSNQAKEISHGNYKALPKVDRGDEIGDLANSFHYMQRTISNLITSLKESNQHLEVKQKAISDSINYARNIQNTILPRQSLLKSNLPDFFVVFQPRDQVSGDFYWAVNVPAKNKGYNEIEPFFKTLNGEAFYLAICDSTGHGVPGAFMSLLNVSFLNEAIVLKDIEMPADILENVKESLTNAFSHGSNKDGMDGVLLYFDPNSEHLYYSGAYNAPIMIRNGEIIKCEIDKIPIGKGVTTGKYRNFKLKIESGDMLYLYSDGFADQFGGPLEKKYKSRKFYEFLSSISHYPATEQQQLVSNEFQTWKGSHAQVDDVIVFGIKF